MPGHVTVTARVGACVQFPELLAAEVFAGDSEAGAPLASLRERLWCGPAASSYTHARTLRECLLCAICFFLVTHLGRERLLSPVHR